MVIPRLPDANRQLTLDFPSGHVIDSRYVIARSLGKGGMGVVYLARDQLVDEEIALKFMRPQRLRSERARQLFIREAQVARRLRHEHIGAVHDVSTTSEGILYLSMEFLKGHSLRSYLRARRNERRYVDVRLAVRLVAQILSALEYAHRTVVHRDIKPENVMLLPGEHIKVLDFGLAKAVDEEPVEPQEGAPAAKRLVGTFAYASPEQKRHREVDHRTDLYAVGLVFRELLTLRTPREEPFDVATLREDVSPSLLRVLSRALKTEKADRWQSAHEFRKSLLDSFEESYQRTSASEIGPDEQEPASTEDMIYMEGGSFLMGSDTGPAEAPEHEVTVAPFHIDRYPVTNAQYAAFVEATGHREPKFWRQANFNGPDQPVVGVSWNDAMAYAQWAGKALPTEPQWEFAARGKANRKFPWGAHEPEPVYCNFGDYLGMPSMVTMHEEGATPEGVCDLAGNVYEWTCDPYLPYAAEVRARMERQGSPRRSVRGGAWNSPAAELRCAARKGLFPESQLSNVGFRCVVSA